jgi:hypothetical protein
MIGTTDVECLSKLTLDEVKSWEYIDDTPVGGKAYYNQELDVAAILYGRTIKVFYNREKPKGKTACFFSDRLVID